jgi:dTMP kinase
MFFSFDGVDGTGKTTQMALFCAWLREQGQRVTECRDPGSTPLGEEIRRILLHAEDSPPVGLRSEMLLYMAARAQLVEELIAPALQRGETVVCDRFLLANVVYQGHAGGLDVDALWQVGKIATAGVQPDLVFLLDMPPAEALARIQRNLDRMEQQDADYRRRLRDGFLIEARRDVDRIAVVDAARSVQEVQAEIRQRASARLAGR